MLEYSCRPQGCGRLLNKNLLVKINKAVMRKICSNLWIHRKTYRQFGCACPKSN